MPRALKRSYPSVISGRLAKKPYMERKDKNVTTLGIPTKEKIWETLQNLKSLFPSDKFDGQLPTVILRHQVYCMVGERTSTDQLLNDLCVQNKIRVFKIGQLPGEFGIVFFEEYKSFILDCLDNAKIPPNLKDKFMKTLLHGHSEVYVSKEIMCEKYGFSERDITLLMGASVLTYMSGDSWWLSIPNAGLFVKNLQRARRTVQMIIRKSKFQEILLSELVDRKSPKSCKFGMTYMAYDFMGSDLVESVESTSGRILKLKED